MSESSVRSSAPPFRAEIQIAKEITSFKGEHFNSIVDIFLILFENIVRHSNMKEKADAKVYVKNIENMICIRVESKVKNSVITEKNKESLGVIQKRIASGEYISSITSEGGTGFYKIYNILKRDFQIQPDIDFGFNDEEKFFVDIKLPSIIIDENKYEHINS